jgi:O-antigen ligase
VAWNQEGALAQPARAVRSEFAPTERDEMSNFYRYQENYNLIVLIKSKQSTGMGFGVPIPYAGIVDLSKDIKAISYVPHNGVLYIWMRMGAAGMIVVSLVLAQAVRTAARVSRSGDRATAAVAAITAAGVFGFTAMGITDMGFSWFRNVIALGILLGLVDALARRQAPAQSIAPGSGARRI